MVRDPAIGILVTLPLNLGNQIFTNSIRIEQTEIFCVLTHPTRRHFTDTMGEDATVLKKLRSRKTNVSQTWLGKKESISSLYSPITFSPPTTTQHSPIPLSYTHYQQAPPLSHPPPPTLLPSHISLTSQTSRAAFAMTGAPLTHLMAIISVRVCVCVGGGGQVVSSYTLHPLPLTPLLTPSFHHCSLLTIHSPLSPFTHCTPP